MCRIYLYSMYLYYVPYLPVLLHVGQISRLRAISLVLPLLLPRRTSAHHLSHGVRVAYCSTRRAEVSLTEYIIIRHFCHYYRRRRHHHCHGL